MTTTITAKMNKPATKFQAGESVGFGIRLGVQYYDRETRQKEWTNYECAIFAKNPQQIQFYQSALIEGAVVEVSASGEKIKKFQGDNGLILSIELIDAKIGYVHSPNQQPQQQQAPRQNYRNQPQQNQQQAPRQNANQGYQQTQQQGYDDYDDNIPFRQVPF